MQYRLYVYTIRKQYNYILFDAFIDDFQGWTKEWFDLGLKDTKRDLRDYLRQHGVYVTCVARYSITQALAKAITHKEIPEWPKEELEKYKKKVIMNSRLDARSDEYKAFYNPKALKREALTREMSVSSTIEPGQQTPSSHRRRILSSSLLNLHLREPAKPKQVAPRSSVEFDDLPKDDDPPEPTNEKDSRPKDYNNEVANVGKCYRDQST